MQLPGTRSLRSVSSPASSGGASNPAALTPQPALAPTDPATQRSADDPITQLRAGLNAALRARASPRTFIVFLFVLLTLTSLSIVPYLAMRRTELLRRQVETAIEPARTMTTRLQLALSIHVAAGRGFLLTGEMQHLVRARTALESARSIVEQLEPLAREIGPTVVQRLERVHFLAVRWYDATRGLVPGETSRSEFLRMLPRHQESFEELLAATAALQREINQIGLQYRTEIIASQRRGLSIAVTLFLSALLAMTAVGWIFWRQRMLLAQVNWARTDAERRAAEED